MTETKDMIKASFLSLYSKRAYGEITVKELCAEVPIARTTFYSYYSNIAELKHEIETETIAEIRRASDGIYESFGRDYFYKTMNYIESRKQVFEAFLVIQPNYEFIKAFKNEIIAHLKENYKNRGGEKNYDLELEIIACGIIGYYTYLLQNPESVDFEALQKKLETLSEIFKMIF